MILPALHVNHFVAASYGCGTYGSGTFESGTACTSQTTKEPPAEKTLVNTGMDIFLPLCIGVVLIVIAISLLIKTRKKR